MQPLVIDNGSGSIKAGYAGEDNPRFVFSTIVGRLKNNASVPEDKRQDFYLGYEASANAGLLLLNYPIEHGVIRNWGDMVKIWEYTLNEQLKEDPSQHPIIMSEPTNTPKSYREKLMEIMFESYNVPSLFLSPASELALNSTFLSHGLVVDIGAGTTSIIGKYGDFILKTPYLSNYTLGGRDLTSWMLNLLQDGGHTFLSNCDDQIIRDIKEKTSYVALDYEAELKKSLDQVQKDYELPNGESFTMGRERFQCPELLFKPYLIRNEADGIHQVIYNTIKSYNIHFQKDLFSNIVLCGGSSLIPGLAARLEKEIKALVPKTVKVKVSIPAEGKYASWIGGSIIGSLDSFPQAVLTKEEYLESGKGSAKVFGFTNSEPQPPVKAAPKPAKAASSAAPEEVQAIVIDNGTGFIKAGFAGEEMPRSEFHPLVGRPKFLETVAIHHNQDYYVGDEVTSMASLLNYKNPIEHSLVHNWDDMEKVWNYAFSNELRVDPSEHPVILSDAPNNPKANRAKMMEIMFETFNVPSLYISNSPRLSLFSTLRTTGLVVDIGEATSSIMAIQESMPINENRGLVSGNELNAYMARCIQMNQLGETASYIKDMRIIADIKKTTAYVAFDYNSELHKAETSEEVNINYELPNGEVIVIGKERFQCPELFFKPSLNGISGDGLLKIISDTIMQSEEEARSELWANVILSGGSTMLEGFPERLEKELSTIAPSSMKVKILALPNRNHATWIGASILGSISTFKHMVFRREEYDEGDLSIAQERFP